MATAQLPQQPEDLSADWFTEVLRAAGHRATVRAVRCERFGAGVGMMSQLLRVTLDYAEGDGPAALIVKLPTETRRNREVAVNFDNYRREVLFYREAAHLTTMRTPAVYLAEVSGPDRFVLVLEDLSDWQLGDQVSGCTPQQARQCMQALAALHASFWGQVDDGSLDWMPNSHASVMSEGLHQGTAALYDTFVTLFAEQIPAPLDRLGPRFIAALPNLQRWIDAQPRTLIHGDFRMDNLFFGAGAGSDAVACCDWQGSVRGKGIHDVAYLLSGSLPIEDRRRSERELVELWRAHLTPAIRARYDADQAWDDYRRAVLYLWTYVVVIGGALDADNPRGLDWINCMVSRSAAAFLDLGCVELLQEFEPH